MEHDFFEKLNRGPQVILKKDAAMIVAHSGLTPGWNVLEAGTGSAFLTIFLANLVQPGKVTSYERKEDFHRLAAKNAGKSGLANIELINKDIARAKVKGEFDMVMLDLKDPARLVKKLDKNLKARGVFVVYSPNIEQIKSVNTEFTKLNYQIKAIDCEMREWKVGISTHPIHSGIIHTGFLIFGYK